MKRKHLFLQIPEDWTNDQRGKFFEEFVADLLRPMRFEVRQRLRVTGMEIDLLAKGLDQPRTILVECKAQRDSLPADTISKLLGNVALRSADAGWLFSTSDLSKDGRGQWEEIQARPDLAAKFVWFPPDRLIEILIGQKSVVEPALALAQHSSSMPDVGDATLVWSTEGKFWLVEILKDGLPTFLTVLDGISGAWLPQDQAVKVAGLSDRFATLEYRDLRATTLGLSQAVSRSPIARVVPGDSWDDLRDPLAELLQKCRFMALEVLGFQIILIFRPRTAQKTQMRCCSSATLPSSPWLKSKTIEGWPPKSLILSGSKSRFRK